MKPYKFAVLSAVAAGSLWNLGVSAQLSYNQGDLLLGLRKPGSGSDLVVDIGAASTYVGATGPIVISGSFYTGTQFTAAGLDINNLYFSVFGDAGLNLGQTLWVTANSPLNSHTTSSQSTAAGQFEAIAQGGEDAGSFYTANAANSSSAVIMPNSFSLSGTDLSYSKGILNSSQLDASGNPVANFQYFPVVNEANTASGFDAGTSPIYLNIYELDASANNNGPAGTQLGYFELDPNGTMTFNPGIAPVPEPGAWSLLGSGLLTLVAIRRMKNKK
jgi:hypothetical protein